MKVLILGPVVNSNVSGGVAVFDEGLYQGFIGLGDDVNILSIEKSKKINNIVVPVRRRKPFNIIFNLRKFGKVIKRQKPDLVISSLHYSIGIKKYKRMWSKAKYIQVLHGFPCAINGRIKAWVINKIAKYSRKHFDYVVAVSFLTYAINKKINRILCDKVIHNGCALVPSSNNKDRIFDFIYIGRLFRDKEVEMIGDAFRILKQRNPNLKLVVCGYGELESLFINGKFKDSGIIFVGKLSQDQVKSYLEQSKFFISMNCLEPFGTVFNEAIMNGCNIVTQSTNGSMALFLNKKYFHCADCVNANDLALRLLEIEPMFSNIPLDEKKSFVEYMSYERCASQYKELYKKGE